MGIPEIVEQFLGFLFAQPLIMSCFPVRNCRLRDRSLSMGKVQKEGRWVPHELSEDNKNRRCDTALTLLSKFRKKEFLHKIFTGDEKWILYDNSKRRKSLTLVNLRH